MEAMTNHLIIIYTTVSETIHHPRERTCYRIEFSQSAYILNDILVCVGHLVYYHVQLQSLLLCYFDLTNQMEECPVVC